MIEGIDWTEPESQVSIYFKVKDCLWLPRWKRYACSELGLNSQILENLRLTCLAMDQVRDFFKYPIIVNSMYRPPEYSAIVGGTRTDVHTKGLAMDWHIDGIPCDYLREQLVPKLVEFGLRLENLPHSTWVHTDIAPVIHNRYFIP